MQDTQISQVKEWRLDLDPPVSDNPIHTRGYARPKLRVAIKGNTFGDLIIELMMDAQFGCQTRYADLTPQEARKLAHALCDMADKFDQETRAA